MIHHDAYEAKQLYNDQFSSFSEEQQQYLPVQIFKNAINQSLGNIQEKTILFAGCGDGQECLYAIEHGARVIGIDISEKSIESAKNKIPNGDFFVMDIAHLTLAYNSCDIIISHFAVMYVEDLVKVLLEFKKVLKDDGLIIISVPHPIRKMIKYNHMNYFVKGKQYENWKGIKRFGYYRLFEDYIEAFTHSNLKLIQLIEPQPIKEHSEILDSEISYPHMLIFKLIK